MITEFSTLPTTGEPVPVLSSSLLEPFWNQFATHLPSRPVFDLVITALIHGSRLERIATRACSDRTVRRRLTTWGEARIGQKVFAETLTAYDKTIGLDLQGVSVDGSTTKAVGGGECAGRSSVDGSSDVKVGSLPFQCFRFMIRPTARCTAQGRWSSECDPRV
ncbi:hypothetical protein [Kineococcus arenarius]|uniref:hypothetical protein n=1 Tax=unclassified Kineococcus TaxID=2621656 RepID=UPI003D7DC461